MTKETFLKELSKNLKYLKPNLRKETLKKYENLPNYNLDPLEEANKIYASLNINFKIYKNIKFFDALNIIINKVQENKKNLSNILLFFLYAFFLIILLKIPFIYVRDMLSTLFHNLSNDSIYIVWSLFIELIYALTSIFFLIKLIKKKANLLEEDMNGQ